MVGAYSSMTSCSYRIISTAPWPRSAHAGLDFYTKSNVNRPRRDKMQNQSREESRGRRSSSNRPPLPIVGSSSSSSSRFSSVEGGFSRHPPSQHIVIRDQRKSTQSKEVGSYHLSAGFIRETKDGSLITKIRKKMKQICFLYTRRGIRHSRKSMPLLSMILTRAGYRKILSSGSS